MENKFEVRKNCFLSPVTTYGEKSWIQLLFLLVLKVSNGILFESKQYDTPTEYNSLAPNSLKQTVYYVGIPLVCTLASRIKDPGRLLIFQKKGSLVALI